MRAFKFLAAGRRHPFTGVSYPDPGVWVAAGDDAADGPEGVRACGRDQLAFWLDAELWEVEPAGTLTAGRFSSTATRARLVRRVEGWNERTGREFAAACAWRARDAVADRLVVDGQSAMAARLRTVETLDDLAATASALVAEAPDAWRDPLGLLAEAGDESQRARLGTATQTATVAVAGWNVDGHASERAWQSAWIADRLTLAPA